MSLSNRHCRIGHLSHKKHLILYVCILPIVNIYCRQREKRDVLALKLVIYFLFSVLRQGGTGFAASGVDLNAKEARPVMQVWCDKQTFGLPSIVARFCCFIFICLGFLWLWHMLSFFFLYLDHHCSLLASFPCSHLKSTAGTLSQAHCCIHYVLPSMWNKMCP